MLICKEFCPLFPWKQCGGDALGEGVNDDGLCLRFGDDAGSNPQLTTTFFPIFIFRIYSENSEKGE